MFHDRRRILINKVPTMTIETTSTSASWSPQGVLNNGNALIWEVSGGVTIPPQTINDPTFDLSTNTGTAVITAKDVSTLIRFELYSRNISSIDVTKAINLTNITLYANNINSIDLLNNTYLEFLSLSSNDLIALNIYNNTNIRTIGVHSNNLTVLDVSNNILLTNLRCDNNPLTPTAIDNIIIDLDNHGLSNGTLRIPTGRTSASDTAYYNLETVKNWIITES